MPSIVEPESVDAGVLRSGRLREIAEHWSNFGERYRGSDGFDPVSATFTTKGVAHSFGSLENVSWDSPFKDPRKSNWAYEFSYLYYLLPNARENPRGSLHVASRLLAQMESKHEIGSGKFHAVWLPIKLANRLITTAVLVHLILDGEPTITDEELAPLLGHIARCEALLRLTVERYLGFNHAAFGLVALCVGGLVLDRPRKHLTDLALEALSVCEEQVLDEGLHAERSPTYHIHVLLLALVLNASKLVPKQAETRLLALIDKMRAALRVVVHEDGEIALFNDCAIDDSLPPTAVGWRPAGQGKQVLVEAGYTRIRSGPHAVIMDSGPMGPDDVIGHGHADFLSIEMSVSGVRLIVDPGVQSTVVGSERDYTRFAKSHNGPVFANHEPAELFGAWRVGYRPTATGADSLELPKLAEFEHGGTLGRYREIDGSVCRYLAVDETAVRLVDVWRSHVPAAKTIRFLIPSDWELEYTGHEVRLSLDSHSYAIKIAGGEISIGSGLWHPRGPMDPRTAHEILITATGDTVMTTIGTRDAEASSFDWNGAAQWCRNRLGVIERG